MPSKHKYSVREIDPLHDAVSYGRELPISYKHSVEICRTIKGMRLESAKNYLNDVISLKKAVPFKRFNKKVAHRRNIDGWDAGRYPKKASMAILRLLNNLEKNAEYKGLEVENLMIKHASASKGHVTKSYFPRAMGRSTLKRRITTNIELLAKEIGSEE